MGTSVASPGARVLVVGGGRQGVAAARLLVARGASCTIVDDGPVDAVTARLAAAGVSGVDACGGGIPLTASRGHDAVVLSAGVPRAHPAVVAALERGVPVLSEIDLCAPLLEDATFIAVTGTNGKSTTTTILGAIARAHDETAFVGGNLGEPLAHAVADGRRPRTVVLELSSYQLETLTQARFRAAVVTNLTPDHLDRYPSADAYYLAKARVFSLLTGEGGSAINRGDAESVRLLDERARGARFDFNVEAGHEGVAIVGRTAVVMRGGAREEVSLDTPFLVGSHNLENAAAAIAAAALAGLPSSSWRQGIADYQGIAHRLERIAEVGGVTFINDSKATNVDAAVKAVASFASGVHLIVGGRGKGAPYAPLVEAARGRARAVYTIGEDAPAVAAAFAGVVDVVPCGDLAAAFARATARATAGDTILLAPACASFDQFRSYEERGARFRALVAAHAAGPEEERP